MYSSALLKCRKDLYKMVIGIYPDVLAANLPEFPNCHVINDTGTLALKLLLKGLISVYEHEGYLHRAI